MLALKRVSSSKTPGKTWMIVCSGYWKKIKFLQFIYIQNVQGKAIEVTGYLIIGTKIKVDKIKHSFNAIWSIICDGDFKPST